MTTFRARSCCRARMGCLCIVAALVAVDCTAGGQQVAVGECTIAEGDLRVSFLDNARSPKVLSGIDSLTHRSAADYDAYDPDGAGASAGLNFEHIISGHPSPYNKFTPRHGPYTLYRLPEKNSVALVRRAQESPWKVGSRLTYRVVAPHYVDFEFRCTCRDASLFGPRGYAIFFFANYMNDVRDVALHFRGHESSEAAETWVAARAPRGHVDWNRGGNYRALGAAELAADQDVKFRLNTWTYDWPRIAQPFYYGLADHGMTLILMFDRLVTERDQIRFSLYKFKLPERRRPAWDFQYVVNQIEQDVEYGFRGRLAWKPFVSADDCQAEYARWAAGLDR